MEKKSNIFALDDLDKSLEDINKKLYDLKKKLNELNNILEDLDNNLDDLDGKLNDLIDENKKKKVEINNYINKIIELSCEEFKKVEKTSKIIYIEDLKIIINDYLEKIPSLKEDLEILNLIDEFINSGDFQANQKEEMNSYVWEFLEFLIYMYGKYEIYLNGKEKSL